MSDFSELIELAADLSDAPAKAGRNIAKALEVTARHIKDDWKQGAEVSSYFPKTYPAAIHYDAVEVGGGEISTEIGPELGRTKGASAGFLEEGGGGVFAPPTHAARDAVEANESDFHRGLEIGLYDATVDAVKAS